MGPSQTGSEPGGSKYEGRYLVIGPPGTGKTTFLARQVRAIVEYYEASALTSWGCPVLICSLTRAAAAEIGSREMPIDARYTRTLHSHCYQVLSRPKVLTQDDVREWNATHGTYLPVEQFKTPRKKRDETVIANDDDDVDRPQQSLEDVRPIFPKTKLEKGVRLLQQSEVLRHRLVPYATWPEQVRAFYDEWKQFREQHEAVDFTDMIERALAVAPVAPHNPFAILVDEAQDLSPLELRLLERWGERASCVMLVGDEFQTLYAFRGSDPSSFNDQSIPSSHRKILSQSYRVPRRVLEASVHWLRSHLEREPPEYRPVRDPFDPEKFYDGSVETRDFTWKNPVLLVQEILSGLEEHADDQTFMVQATCSYMLRRVISGLRDCGVPFSNPWRLKRFDWNPIAWKTMRIFADTLTTCSDSPGECIRPWTYGILSRFLSTIDARDILRRGAKSRIAARAETTQDHDGESAISEFVQLEELEEWLGADSFLIEAWSARRTERELVEWWAARARAKISESLRDYVVKVVTRFGSRALRDPPRVFVGSCHSFKGSESDHVYVFPDVSPMAFRNWSRFEGSEYEEIVRTFYVAMTRAKQALVVCKNSDRMCVPLHRVTTEYLDSISESPTEESETREPHPE